MGVQEVWVSGIPGLRSETWGTLCGFLFKLWAEGKMGRLLYGLDPAPFIPSWTDARSFLRSVRATQERCDRSDLFAMQKE